MGVSVVEALANVKARIELDHDRPLIAVDAHIEPKLVASVSCSVDDIEEAIDLVCKHLAVELRRQLVAKHEELLRRHNPARSRF